MKKVFSIAVYVTVLEDVASIAVYSSVNHITVFKTFRTVSHFEAMKTCAKLGIILKNVGKYTDLLQGSKEAFKWF